MVRANRTVRAGRCDSLKELCLAYGDLHWRARRAHRQFEYTPAKRFLVRVLGSGSWVRVACSKGGRPISPKARRL